MKIYLENETNFKNNGLGFLTDCLSAIVTEELNGEYNLTLTYPLNSTMSKYLVLGNIIKCKVKNQKEQLFKIKQIDKNYSLISVYATHIFYNLLDNFIEDAAPTNLDPASACNWILNKTTYSNNFSAYSDISEIASARYVRRNPVECIIGDQKNSMINLYGAEIERDNFLIKLLSRRGSDNHVKLTFGKNIKEIEITTDITQLYTKILPIGFDGLMLPEKYVDSPLINNYPTPKIRKYEFSDIRYDPSDPEAYQTLTEAYQALRNAVNSLYDAGIDKPSINIKVDWLELSKTQEYYNQYSAIETVNLGDTITADILGVKYETRVIKTQYNPLTDRIDVYEIGNFKPSFQNTVNSIAESVENVNVNSILSQAKDTATALITSAMGGYVYKTQNELYIMDTNNPNTAKKVWRWNLNGLGYSNTGINGPYGIAMTQDGSIVADFITSGKINTNLIEGYNSLTASVNKLVALTDYIRTKSSNNKLMLENTAASYGAINKLSIKGTDIMPLYPGMTFPGDLTYPGTLTMYELIVDNSGELNDNSEHVYIQSPIALRKYNGTYDEIIVENNVAFCIQRIGIDSSNNLYILDEPINHYIGPATIPTYKGTTYIYLRYFSTAIFECEYIIQNDLTNNFATKSETQATINITDKLNLQVQNKCGKDEVVNQLNISKDAILIKGNRFLLEADNLKIDQLGNIYLNNGSKVIGGDGLLTNLQFVSGNELQFLGFSPYDTIGGTISDNNYSNIIINASIPNNFTIMSAIITLIHSPVNYYDGFNNSDKYFWGYSRKIKAYKTLDLQNYYKKAAIFSSYYKEGSGNLQEIENSFGTNGFTASTPSDSSHNTETVYSLDIKSELTTGWNRIVLQSADDMPYNSDFEQNAVVCSEKTGSAIAVLNILGYTSFEN